MSDPLLDLPGYSLRRAAATVTAEFSARLEPLGLRFHEFAALLLIEGNPRITASKLGRMLDIQRANMAPLVARMEAAALIVRQPLDGKSHGLNLTAPGRAKLAEARALIDALHTELMRRVPDEHRGHLKPALDALWRG